MQKQVVVQLKTNPCADARAQILLMELQLVFYSLLWRRCTTRCCVQVKQHEHGSGSVENAEEQTQKVENTLDTRFPVQGSRLKSKTKRQAGQHKANKQGTSESTRRISISVPSSARKCECHQPQRSRHRCPSAPRRSQ